MASNSLDDLISKLEEIQLADQAVIALQQSTIEQETEALNAILKKIKPLLAVTSHKIQISYRESGEKFSTSHKKYHDKRGLVLLDHFSPDCYDRDTRGAYTGWRLILWQDGTLSCMERVGEWSRWQGESSGWYIGKEEDLTTEQAVMRYGLVAIMEGLADEIKEASEKLRNQQAEYEAKLAMIARIRETMA